MLKKNKINSVNGFKIGDAFYFNDILFRVIEFKTRHTVVGTNIDLSTSKPFYCTVYISKILKI